MWGQKSPSFGKYANISRGAELSRGSKQGSPNVPARGSVPWQRRLRAATACSSGKRAARCLRLRAAGFWGARARSRPGKVGASGPAPRAPLHRPGSGSRSPFLEMNAPARLSGSPFLVLLMLCILMYRPSLFNMFSVTTDTQKHSPLENRVWKYSGSSRFGGAGWNPAVPAPPAGPLCQRRHRLCVARAAGLLFESPVLSTRETLVKPHVCVKFVSRRNRYRNQGPPRISGRFSFVKTSLPSPARWLRGGLGSPWAKPAGLGARSGGDAAARLHDPDPLGPDLSRLRPRRASCHPCGTASCPLLAELGPGGSRPTRIHGAPA